MDNKY